MTKKSQNRYLKFIVFYCIFFISAIILAAMTLAWFGIDIQSILTTTCSVFGGELLLACALKLVGGRKSKDDQG